MHTMPPAPGSLAAAKLEGAFDISKVAPMASAAVATGLESLRSEAARHGTPSSIDAAAADLGAGTVESSSPPGATAKHADTTGPASPSPAPPPSRIPPAFHVRDEAGRLIFPAERPAGDAHVGLLADTLGTMLEEWRGRLGENKPSFPLGAARWGVLQMCMYDM